MSTQWRAGGFGVIGLDYPAMEWTSQRLCPRVDVDWRMLRKLQALERFELARLHGEKNSDEE